MKAFIHNQIQDEKVFRYCYKTRGLFVHKVVPKSIEKWTSYAANSKLLVNIFPCVESCINDLKIINTTASVARTYILGIICPSMLTVSLTEEIMFTDKYPCIFLRQIETIVYLMHKNERKNKQTYKNYLAKQNLN